MPRPGMEMCGRPEAERLRLLGREPDERIEALRRPMEFGRDQHVAALDRLPRDAGQIDGRPLAHARDVDRPVLGMQPSHPRLAA